MTNMYKDIPTRNFIGGECLHKCSYCYVNDLKKRLPGCRKKYSGEIRLIESEFKRGLSKGNTYFIGSCIDMFAWDTPIEIIIIVLEYLMKFPDNIYLLQTKNPECYIEVLEKIRLTPNIILGTTIETNKSRFLFNYVPTFIPAPGTRAKYLHDLVVYNHKKFVTIEPILDFDLDDFVNMIEYANPDWVWIGADSKGHNLPEPSWDKVQALITELEKFTEVRIKDNLYRLKGV